jgi:hypothetical protein
MEDREPTHWGFQMEPWRVWDAHHFDEEYSIKVQSDPNPHQSEGGISILTILFQISSTTLQSIFFALKDTSLDLQ